MAELGHGPLVAMSVPSTVSLMHNPDITAA